MGAVLSAAPIDRDAGDGLLVGEGFVDPARCAELRAAEAEAEATFLATEPPALADLVAPEMVLRRLERAVVA